MQGPLTPHSFATSPGRTTMGGTSSNLLTPSPPGAERTSSGWQDHNRAQKKKEVKQVELVKDKGVARNQCIERMRMQDRGKPLSRQVKMYSERTRKQAKASQPYSIRHLNASKAVSRGKSSNCKARHHSADGKKRSKEVKVKTIHLLLVNDL